MPTPTEQPISQQSKHMVYQALGALEMELEQMGMAEQATEVYTIRQHLKSLDEQGKLVIKKVVRE